MAKYFGLNVTVLLVLLVLSVVIGMIVFVMRPKISSQMVGDVKDDNCWDNCMNNCLANPVESPYSCSDLCDCGCNGLNCPYQPNFFK